MQEKVNLEDSCTVKYNEITVDSHGTGKVRYIYLLNMNVGVSTKTLFTELYLCDIVCEKFRIAPSVR